MRPSTEFEQNNGRKLLHLVKYCFFVIVWIVYVIYFAVMVFIKYFIKENTFLLYLFNIVNTQIY